MQVTDPVLGAIEFFCGAWDGVVPFEFPGHRKLEFALHVWADASGPTAGQRATFEGLCARYAALWPAFARSLAECHPELTTEEEVERSLLPIVGCYIEAGATAGHNDFELVYTFDRPGEGSRGFFVRVVGWEIAETVMAE
jgi:hypothetical protein